MSRLAPRLRLTLAFAVAMAVVLAAAGSFVYLRLGDDLTATIDSGLRSRAADVGALVQQADTGLKDAHEAGTGPQGPGPAQILDARGRVFDATPQLRSAPLLTGAELRRALHGPVILDVAGRPGLPGPIRVLATPVTAQDRHLLVVVGASLRERDAALGRLGALLLIGGPISLLLASLAGYAMATAALRPVDDLLARLRAALARERTFVADASHELRTPLAVLKGELELARAEGRDHEQLLAALGSAAEETDRLARMAEELLVIARLDQGHSRIPIDQAVDNLLDNARRHGREPVELRVQRSGGMLELHVLDSGDGFPGEYLPHAFERFSQADPARASGGSGLGLAIVEAIAAAHGGEAHARNRPEGGADVWIAFPAGVQEESRWRRYSLPA
jgi:signal transduction histidine kinase